MAKFLGTLVIIAALLGAIGWGMGWFTIRGTDSSGATNVTLALDKDELKHDLHVSQTKYDEKMRSVDAKLDQLKARAKTAAGDTKVALDKAIDELDEERRELGRKLGQLKDTTADKLSALKDDIAAAFDKLEDKLERALAKFK